MLIIMLTILIVLNNTNNKVAGAKRESLAVSVADYAKGVQGEPLV